MAHKNEDLLRSAYGAFSRGDMDRLLAMCENDMVWHVPGRNQLTGDYKGRDGFMQLVGKVMELSGGTFSEEAHDLLANEEHGVALLTHSLERDGKKHQFHTVHVWQIKNGKFTEWWEHPDPVAFDEAWA
jgi:uncharacterized protein